MHLFSPLSHCDVNIYFGLHRYGIEDPKKNKKSKSKGSGIVLLKENTLNAETRVDGVDLHEDLDYVSTPGQSAQRKTLAFDFLHKNGSVPPPYNMHACADSWKTAFTNCRPPRECIHKNLCACAIHLPQLACAGF